ncbi:MAG: DUF5110 domain-containing protein [Balneolaceae bacterium]|nr:DUF5110 domain-containing protein [Balneolaceae bacterium]
MLLLAALIVLSCARVPDSDFYEAEGIVSVHSLSLIDNDSWTPFTTLISESALSVEHDDGRSGAMEVNFYVRRPGSYTLWLLGRNDSEHSPAVRMFDDNNFLMDSYRSNLTGREIPIWTSSDKGGDRMLFDLPSAGHYRLVIESGGVPGILIDRIHFTLNNRNRPWGMGYPETLDAVTDPRLLKREHTVHIPPKWSFGLITSSHEAKDHFTSRTGLSPDAYWQNGTEKELRGEFEGSDSGEFIYLSDTESIAELREAYQSSTGNSDKVKRGFILAPFNRLDDPEFKKYPALWQLSDEREDGYRELRRQLERTGNPRKASYEVPFSLFMPPWALPNYDGGVDDELFLRWAQAAALNTHFVLPFPSEDIYSPGAELLEAIEELTEFRRTLFPYIYSYTLRARTSRIKPVIGREDSPDQFMLGENLLVAPITERGRSSRTVYFPEGQWINIFDEERFEGGQSWVVEEIGSLPLIFTKPGAIIPMWPKGEMISEAPGDELLVDIFAGESGNFRLYEDDGVSTAYRTGDFTTIAFRYFEHTDYATFNIGAIVRDFEGQRRETDYTLRFRNMREPASIKANGEELSSGSGEQMWSYDPNQEVLHIRWSQPNNQRTEFEILFSD